jgi:hypothetical protein
MRKRPRSFNKTCLSRITTRVRRTKSSCLGYCQKARTGVRESRRRMKMMMLERCHGYYQMPATMVRTGKRKKLVEIERYCHLCHIA